MGQDDNIQNQPIMQNPTSNLGQILIVGTSALFSLVILVLIVRFLYNVGAPRPKS